MIMSKKMDLSACMELLFGKGHKVSPNVDVSKYLPGMKTVDTTGLDKWKELLFKPKKDAVAASSTPVAKTLKAPDTVAASKASSSSSEDSESDSEKTNKKQGKSKVIPSCTTVVKNQLLLTGKSRGRIVSSSEDGSEDDDNFEPSHDESSSVSSLEDRRKKIVVEKPQVKRAAVKDAEPAEKRVAVKDTEPAEKRAKTGASFTFPTTLSDDVVRTHENTQRNNYVHNLLMRLYPSTMALHSRESMLYANAVSDVRDVPGYVDLRDLPQQYREGIHSAITKNSKINKNMYTLKIPRTKPMFSFEEIRKWGVQDAFVDYGPLQKNNDPVLYVRLHEHQELPNDLKDAQSIPFKQSYAFVSRFLCMEDMRVVNQCISFVSDDVVFQKGNWTKQLCRCAAQILKKNDHVGRQNSWTVDSPMNFSPNAGILFIVKYTGSVVYYVGFQPYDILDRGVFSVDNMKEFVLKDLVYWQDITIPEIKRISNKNFEMVKCCYVSYDGPGRVKELRQNILTTVKATDLKHGWLRMQPRFVDLVWKTQESQQQFTQVIGFNLFARSFSSDDKYAKEIKQISGRDAKVKLQDDDWKNMIRWTPTHIRYFSQKLHVDDGLRALVNLLTTDSVHNFDLMKLIVDYKYNMFAPAVPIWMLVNGGCDPTVWNPLFIVQLVPYTPLDVLVDRINRFLGYVSKFHVFVDSGTPREGAWFTQPRVGDFDVFDVNHSSWNAIKRGYGDMVEYQRQHKQDAMHMTFVNKFASPPLRVFLDDATQLPCRFLLRPAVNRFFQEIGTLDLYKSAATANYMVVAELNKFNADEKKKLQEEQENMRAVEARLTRKVADDCDQPLRIGRDDMETPVPVRVDPSQAKIPSKKSAIDILMSPVPKPCSYAECLGGNGTPVPMAVVVNTPVAMVSPPVYSPLPSARPKERGERIQYSLIKDADYQALHGWSKILRDSKNAVEFAKLDEKIRDVIVKFEQRKLPFAAEVDNYGFAIEWFQDCMTKAGVDIRIFGTTYKSSLEGQRLTNMDLGGMAVFEDQPEVASGGSAGVQTDLLPVQAGGDQAVMPVDPPVDPQAVIPGDPAAIMPVDPPALGPPVSRQASNSSVISASQFDKFLGIPNDTTNAPPNGAGAAAAQAEDGLFKDYPAPAMSLFDFCAGSRCPSVSGSMFGDL